MLPQRFASFVANVAKEDTVDGVDEAYDGPIQGYSSITTYSEAGNLGDRRASGSSPSNVYLATIGLPLWKASSFRELLIAISNVLEGASCIHVRHLPLTSLAVHECLYKHDFLHCYISPSNILLAEPLEENHPFGVMADLELELMPVNSPASKRRVSRINDAS